MNIATCIICAGLCAVIVLVIRKLIRDKKSGKTCSGCSGGSCCNCGKK